MLKGKELGQMGMLFRKWPGRLKNVFCIWDQEQSSEGPHSSFSNKIEIRTARKRAGPGGEDPAI